MSQLEDKDLPADDTDARLEQATEWFLRMRSESARVEDLPELKRWMESEPRNALAYQQVSASWDTLGAHASAPEIVIGRRDALEDARRAARQRWKAPLLTHRWPAFAAAAAIAIAVLAGGAWQYAHRNVYETDLGERRTLTLNDGSVITLDARSRIRVDYKESERLIALEQGQARFDVARDSIRPFRVRAGAQTVVALGTQFNVELVAGTVLVTMIEGHVAVTGVTAGALSEPEPPTIELRTGEGLRVRADGQAAVVSKIDIGRATAWQSGKMFFDDEPLSSAAERVNRYSRLQIEVDPSIANVGISGVFNAGDANAFIEAISAYFPVEINRTSASEIHLSARH